MRIVHTHIEDSSLTTATKNRIPEGAERVFVAVSDSNRVVGTAGVQHTAGNGERMLVVEFDSRTTPTVKSEMTQRIKDELSYLKRRMVWVG